MGGAEISPVPQKNRISPLSLMIVNNISIYMYLTHKFSIFFPFYSYVYVFSYQASF